MLLLGLPSLDLFAVLLGGAVATIGFSTSVVAAFVPEPWMADRLDGPAEP